MVALPEGGDDGSDATIDGSDARAPAEAAIDAAIDAAVDATVAADAGASDATLDTGAFDVTILYADANRLPEITAPTVAEGGSDAPAVKPPWAYWPVCPPDSIDPNSGFAVPPESGPCAAPVATMLPDGATQWSDSGAVWLTSASCDSCARTSFCVGDNGLTFPPCSDLRDAGLITTGPGQGLAQFDVCAALLTCMLQTGCWAGGGLSTGPTACYCGGADPNGNCTTAGFADGGCRALEEQAQGTMDPAKILGNFIANVPILAAQRVFSCISGVCNAECVTDE